MRWFPRGYGGERRSPEQLKRDGWRDQKILVVSANDDRLSWPKRELHPPDRRETLWTEGIHTMNKRKNKRLKHSRWDRTHCGCTREVTEPDPNGVEVTHHRTVDTLGLMLNSGAITTAMHDAARDFQASFTIACFDNMPQINLNSFVQSTSSANAARDLTGLADRCARTRRACTRCARRPRLAGRIVRLACRRHAVVHARMGLRQGWGGRPVRQESAQGILVAALGVLAKHYGLRDDGVRRCA